VRVALILFKGHSQAYLSNEEHAVPESSYSAASRSGLDPRKD
jgi:hypothetical protein